MMRVCVLSSGSKGNSTLVSGGGTSVLIDAGLSCKQMIERLDSRGISPDELSGVLITHGHSDHIGGVPLFCGKFGLPVYCNESTAMLIERSHTSKRPLPEFVIFETGCSFSIGELEVASFSLPHDAIDTVGYSVSYDETRISLATDLGVVTDTVKLAMSNSNAWLIESNHDYEMLVNSGRSHDLIGRIHGRHGHLENRDACEFVAACCPEQLRNIILMHLSEDCNSPILARDLMRATLNASGRRDVRIDVAEQFNASEIFEI